MYGKGSKESMTNQMARAREAGAKGLIVTLDCSSRAVGTGAAPGPPSASTCRLWRVRPRGHRASALATRLRQTRKLPDLTTPNGHRHRRAGPDLLRRLRPMDTARPPGTTCD